MGATVKKCLQDSNYRDSYQSGLGAIKNQYRKKIRVNDPRNLKGSMDIDETCKESEPNAHRWDYLVVIRKSNLENLALIEIHRATSPGNVDEVIKKKEWLFKWLYRVRLVNFKKKLIWIAADGVCISPQSRYAKKLAESGILMPKKVTPYLDTDVEYL